MELKNGKYILEKAKNNGYAVGAFNFSNLEQLKAILNACEEENCDVIVQTSPSAIKYMGLDIICPMVENLAKDLHIAVGLNLDHGKDFEMIKKCVDAGYTNVMIDASDLSFEQNVELTKKCVEYAHLKGASVEAELGSLKGVEDDVAAAEHIYTNPDDVERFVKATGVDSLAISIAQHFFHALLVVPQYLVYAVRVVRVDHGAVLHLDRVAASAAAAAPGGIA